MNILMNLCKNILIYEYVLTVYVYIEALGEKAQGRHGHGEHAMHDAE